MVAGIIVSYQPNPGELIIHINELLEEVDIILLIENGSNKTIQVELENKLQNTKTPSPDAPYSIQLSKASSSSLSSNAVEPRLDVWKNLSSLGSSPFMVS